MYNLIQKGYILIHESYFIFIANYCYRQMSLYCFFVHNKAHPSAAACGLESFLSPTERSDEKTIRGTLVLCYWGPWLDELFQSQLLYIYKNTSSYLQ